MKPAAPPPGSSRAGANRDVDVLKHLADSLRAQGRRYRKRLQECQQRFSEEAVHQSRVQTRRLLATVELLEPFVPDRDSQKVRAALKQHLDTFAKLRDTQVQLVYVGRMTRVFPAARAFHEWLLERELRFTERTRRRIKRIKSKRLTRRLGKFELKLRRLRKKMKRNRAFENVLAAMNRGFTRVAQLSRRVKAADTRTIHRTRIAFKRFRYMVEALAPQLPALTEHHRQAVRGYQSIMGDIQDVEVLLAAFDKFLRRHEINAGAARHLRNEMLRRRQWLIQVHLNAARKLRQFWPPPGFALADERKRKRKPNDALSKPGRRGR